MILALFCKELGDLVRQPRALLAALLYGLLVVPVLGAVLHRQAPAPSCLHVLGNSASPLGIAVVRATALPACSASSRNRLSLAVGRTAVLVDPRDWRGSDAALQSLVARMRDSAAIAVATSTGVSRDRAVDVARAVRVVPKSAPASGGLAVVLPLLALFLAALGAVYPAL